MSKHFLKDQLANRAQGNYFFSAIKRSWAKQSLEQSIDYVWKERINPSSLSFSMCPWQDVRDRAAGRKASEAEGMQYMQVGNYLHIMLQDQALKCDDLLWEKPVFLTPEENAKLEEHWPEIPFFWTAGKVSGRADINLKIHEAPVLADIKIKQMSNKETWAKFKIQEDHKTQVCVGIHALNMMGVYRQKIKKGVVLYFNPCITPNKDDGYKECYFDFEGPLEEMTILLLDHYKTELDNLLAGTESVCTYPHCKKHFPKEKSE